MHYYFIQNFFFPFSFLPSPFPLPSLITFPSSSSIPIPVTCGMWVKTKDKKKQVKVEMQKEGIFGKSRRRSRGQGDILRLTKRKAVNGGSAVDPMAWDISSLSHGFCTLLFVLPKVKSIMEPQPTQQKGLLCASYLLSPQ